MHRVALIYNPASGQHSFRRTAFIQQALAELRKAGIDAEAFETTHPGAATEFARQAHDNGFDTVLACGGDGTVHEILQCLVGTRVALGVVPLGTANALAQNLGLGTDPVKAIRKLLAAPPVQIPVGRITYCDAARQTQSRYFVVAAGIGADALLMKQLNSELKRRFGYLIYLVQAVAVWTTYRFPHFKSYFTIPGRRDQVEQRISQLLAIRIRSFGGALRHFAPGATLHGTTLRLMAFRTQNRFRYLSFLMAALFGRHTFTHSITLLDAERVECRSLNGNPHDILVEADGEALGSLPAQLEVVPEALYLLIPPDAQP